jgi:predicted metal-dependent TIM-barrel fold hydrolase
MRVEGYKRPFEHFKTDLRNVCKEKLKELYFSPVETVFPVKNLGQLTFGIPKCKGLFQMSVERETDTGVDIKITLDLRSRLCPPEVIEKINQLLAGGLKELASLGVIESWEG